MHNISVIYIPENFGHISLSNYNKILGADVVVLNSNSKFSLSFVKDKNPNILTIDDIKDILKKTNIEIDASAIAKYINSLENSCYCTTDPIKDDILKFLNVDKTKNSFYGIYSLNNLMEILQVPCGTYFVSFDKIKKDEVPYKTSLLIYGCNSNGKALKSYLQSRYGENAIIDYVVYDSGNIEKNFSCSDELDSVQAVYIEGKNFYHRQNYDFNDFVDIISVLRGPEGCPWDRAQTHNTLRKYMIEEAYEAVGAIDACDDSNLCEELGDVLLQIVLHANIAEQNKEFRLTDIIDSISKKMIHRHAHVFGNRSASNPDEVKKLWEEIKAEEKGKTGEPSAFDKISEVSDSLPTLMFSDKIQAKAAKFGFDFEKIDDTFDKVEEELEEVRQEVQKSPQNKENIEDEVGDLLFSVVNLSRFADVDPDIALRKACKKFKNRFQIMENLIKNDKKSLKDLTLEQIDVYWNRSKNYF